MTLIAFVTIAALAFFIFFQLGFLFKNRDRLSDPLFSKKYDSLYKDVEVESPGHKKILFTFLFCLRRIALVFVIVFIRENWFFKIQAILLLTLL